MPSETRARLWYDLQSQLATAQLEYRQIILRFLYHYFPCRYDPDWLKLKVRG